MILRAAPPSRKGPVVPDLQRNNDPPLPRRFQILPQPLLPARIEALEVEASIRSLHPGLYDVWQVVGSVVRVVGNHPHQPAHVGAGDLFQDIA
jgi:hypothetical protein